MTRILRLLSAINFLMLLLAFGFGWLSFARKSQGNPVEDLTLWKGYEVSTYALHVFLGLVASTTTLAVHCLIFIYFLGTGRWVKEVAIAYKIPDDPLPKLTRTLKRRSFPPALFAMLIVIATTSAGAGVATKAWPWPVHATLAVLTLAINAWAYFVEYRDVAVNGKVIEDVMREVDRIRAERGLPTNEEELRRQQEAT